MKFGKGTASKSFDKQVHEDVILSRAAVMPIVVLMTQLLLLYGFGLLQAHNGIRILAIGICAFFVFRAVPVVAKRQFVFSVLLVMGIITCLLINFLVYPDTVSVASVFLLDFMAMCMPTFLCMRSINNMQVFLKLAEKGSVYINLIGVVYIALQITGYMAISSSYSMSFSYYLLLAGMVFFYNFVNTYKVYYLLQCILNVFCILMSGSRGPLACLGIAITLTLIFNAIGKRQIKRVVAAIVISLGIVTFYDKIVMGLQNLMIWLGVSSRTVNLLVSGQFISHDSERTILYEAILGEITTHPFWGLGFAGDRLILNTYPHNLFLEIMAHFGMVFGIIIILLLLCSVCYAYYITNDKILFICMFCYGFVPLMVSGTYLTSMSFWMFLGYCFNILCNKNCKNVEIEINV